MKKWITLCLGIVCVLSLVGCFSSGTVAEQGTESTVTQEEAPVRRSAAYSFSGENEYIRISSGSIVIGDENEMFDGGELELLQPELFGNVASYYMTFYTLRGDGERNEFHSVNATGIRNGAEDINGTLGSSSGNGFIIVNPEQGVWFELITIDADGVENTYQLELTLSENGT